MLLSASHDPMGCGANRGNLYWVRVHCEPQSSLRFLFFLSLLEVTFNMGPNFLPESPTSLNRLVQCLVNFPTIPA